MVSEEVPQGEEGKDGEDLPRCEEVPCVEKVPRNKDGDQGTSLRKGRTTLYGGRMTRNFLKERSSFLNMRGSYRPTLLAILFA